MHSLETKYLQPGADGPGVVLGAGAVIDGYASVFGVRDQGGDVVMPGAYAAALARRTASGGEVRGVWRSDQGRRAGGRGGWAWTPLQNRGGSSVLVRPRGLRTRKAPGQWGLGALLRGRLEARAP